MNMNELARKEAREYKRQWRAANKDRVRQYNANYWRKRAEKRQAEQQADAKKEAR